MDIQEVLDILDNIDFKTTTYSEYDVETPFEIKPKDFIEFAEKDFTSKYKHKDINALSNAKRSLDCQLDTLLFAFGLYEKSKKENWNFPQKLKIINELGILAPKVLARINKKRNLMEHEFVKPNPEQIEDFIDIVLLFLEATNRFSHNLIDSCGFQLVKHEQTNNNYTFNCDGDILLEGCTIKIEIIKYINNKPLEKEEFELDCNDPSYIKFLRSYIQKTMRY